MGMLKKIGVKVASGINSVAKTLSTSSLPIVASAAKLVDTLIDDNKIEAMKTAAARDGVTKVEKVEETIKAEAAAQGVTDATIVNTAVKAAAVRVSEETATTISDDGASVSVTTWEKVKAFCKKYWKWLAGCGAALLAAVVLWLTTRKGGKKRYRR